MMYTGYITHPYYVYIGKFSSVYGSNISPLVVDVTYQTEDRLHVKIYDPNNQRWEVPTQ